MSITSIEWGDSTLSTSSVIVHYKSSSVGAGMCVIVLSKKGQSKRTLTRVRVEVAGDQRRRWGQIHWIGTAPDCWFDFIDIFPYLVDCIFLIGWINGPTKTECHWTCSLEVPFGWAWVPLMPSKDFTHVMDIPGQPETRVAPHTLSSRACLTQRVQSATYTAHTWTQLNKKYKLSGDSLNVQPFFEPGPLVPRLLPARVSSWLVQKWHQNSASGQVGMWVQEQTLPSRCLSVIHSRRLTGELSQTFLPAGQALWRLPPAVF